MRSFQHYYRYLSRLAKDSSLVEVSRQEALAQLTKLISEAMDVERVGIWTYINNKESIVSECIWSDEHKDYFKGEELKKSAYPIYFSYLFEERLMVSQDSLRDPLVREFVNNYLIPHNIRSMMDAPIYFDGEMVGILCCEKTHTPRNWTLEDQSFAMSCADFVGRIFEAEQRKGYEIELKQKIHFLEIEAKDRLRELEEMGHGLRQMISSMPYPVVIIDEHLQSVAMSETFAQRYNLTTFTENPLWLERIRQGLAGDELGMDEELLQINESDVWLRWKIVPWTQGPEQIEGVVMSYEDITIKKETDLRLGQAAKLAALGEMAGGIAHEINNPLSIIQGYIELMKKNLQRKQIDDESIVQHIDKTKVTIQRISSIVESMRKIARDSSRDDFVFSDLLKVVDDTHVLIREKFRHHSIELIVDCPDIPVMVNCRPVEISQVLMNLLSNAFQAAEGQPQAWVKLELRQEREAILIMVTDCGKGIDKKYLDKIFQPFFTTKDVGAGTGLGLSIGRSIIEQHGGKLYYNEHAPHTCFVISLPNYR